jgi:hypothetical protein
MACGTLLGACEEMRQDAELMRAYTCDDRAAILESCADAFQVAIEEWLNTPLTCAEAAAETGRSPTTIRRYLTDGKLLQIRTVEQSLVTRRELFDVASFTDPEDEVRRMMEGREID